MALGRDLALLEALTSAEARRRGSLSVTRMAAMSGMDKGVVSRALRTMESEGVVLRDPDTMEYRLGWRLPLLVISSEVSSVIRLSNKTMLDLATSFPETVQSFVILRNNRVFLPYNVSAGGAFRDQPWSARGYVPFTNAPGRALLSDHTQSDLRRMFPNGLALAEAPHCRVRSVDELATLLHVAHENGFASSDGDFEPGLAGAAAPIRNHSGRIVAAINVSGLNLPNDAAERKRALHDIGREIARSVGRLSNELGWIQFPSG